MKDIMKKLFNNDKNEKKKITFGRSFEEQDDSYSESEKAMGNEETEQLSLDYIEIADNDDKKKKSKRKHHFVRNLCAVIAIIICTLGVFIFLTERWAFQTWPNLKMEEIIFQLTNNVKGTGGGIIENFITKCILPAVIILAALIVFSVAVHKHAKMFRNIITIEICFGVAIGGFSFQNFYVKADVKGYLEAQNSSSEFIEDNYDDPSTTSITFPEQKRNLIYIYLESMEDTYADEANGGAFSYNCIPELTELAEENECFAGNTGKLNGGYAYQNTHYTSAAMFAQTTGLPLQLNTDYLTLNNHDVFYPNITSIGNILENQGYRNVLLIGSDGDFGNRAAYFTSHGNYEIRDYQYAIDQQWIPSDYHVWWGYEDQKLFENAKTTLNELASGDEPFNLTMLTVDTHFEDGYVCDLCQDEFDTQYANVMACSSRQVAAFIEWCKTQSWYENTTIVINGDHKTMDSDFCNDVSADYDRKTYTCYINSAVTPVDPDKKREFSTLDNFPTTLAALGCTIEGNRLGLGTNLFSDTETLTEKYGSDKMDTEMRNKSEWLIEQSDVSPNLSGIVTYTEREDGGLSVAVSNVTYSKAGISKVIITAESDSKAITREMLKISDGLYETKLSAAERNNGNPFHIKIDVYFDDDSSWTLYERLYSPEYQTAGSLSEYLSMAENANCDILLATSVSQETDVLSESDCEILNTFGFKDASYEYGTGYVAALTENGIEVKCENSKATLTGTLSDGTEYSLTSSSGTNTNLAKIVVDGQNYAKNAGGLNIVLVDRNTGLVEDYCVYVPETGALNHQ